MRIKLRTNKDDWRELIAEYAEITYDGHSVPEFIWIDLLRAAGVEVVVEVTDFEIGPY